MAKPKPKPRILPTEAPRSVLCNPFIVIPHCWTATKNCDLKEINIIECGVFSGFLAFNIMHALRLWTDKKINYYALDTFEGFPYNGSEQSLYKEGDLAPENTSKVIAELLDEGVKVLKGRVEDTLVPLLTQKEDLLFDFAFIDLDLLEPTKFCVERLQSRINVGGRIGFHDYDHHPDYALKALAPYIDSRFSGKPDWCEARRKLNKPDKRYVFFQRMA